VKILSGRTGNEALQGFARYHERDCCRFLGVYHHASVSDAVAIVRNRRTVTTTALLSRRWIGPGGTALFALAGIAAPEVSWSVSAPITAACAAVAIFGFWPAIRHGSISLSRKISLRDAALRLYEECRGTSIGRSMEDGTGCQEDVLDRAGQHILLSLPLEVKRPPSTKWEPLDPLSVGRLMVCGGAMGLKFHGSSSVAYPEVRLMRRRDLARLIGEHNARSAIWR
jgi:hypothetical protein